MTNAIINYLKACTLLIVFSSLPNLLPAQTNGGKPYAGEDEVAAKLFNLDVPATNYHFTAELPGGNFVIIEWVRLSNWDNKADLEHIISLARHYAEPVQDSFKAATTAKRLDIHIPLENEPVTVRVTEHTTTSSVLLLKGSVQTQLKVNMDTIRVLRTIGTREIRKLEDDKLHKERELVQVQYTFLLKDIDQIKNVDNDKATTANVSDRFDSVVNKYRHRWFNEDKWTHNLTVNYYPNNDNPKKRMTVNRVKYETEEGRYYHASEVDWGVGATLFRNQVCPITDVGVSYKWQARYSAYNFVRISGTTFPDIIWNSTTSFDVYPLQYLNLEFGFIKNRQNAHIPLYQLSLGFGWLFNTLNDPTFGITDAGLRSFITFKISKTFSITLEGYGRYTGLTGLIRLY